MLEVKELVRDLICDRQSTHVTAVGAICLTSSINAWSIFPKLDTPTNSIINSLKVECVRGKFTAESRLKDFYISVKNCQSLCLRTE